MTDDRPWNHTIVTAQKSGQQVSCTTASGYSAKDTARNWLQQYSRKQVLTGEIKQAPLAVRDPPLHSTYRRLS